MGETIKETTTSSFVFRSFVFRSCADGSCLGLIWHPRLDCFMLPRRARREL
jgi:hypothetical protein